MQHSQSKLPIIIISCLLHALILILLFIFYNTGSPAWDYTEFVTQTSHKSPETVFYEPEPPKPTTAPPSDDGRWAQLNAQSGPQATSMEMLEGEEVTGTSDQTQEKEETLLPESSDNQDAPLSDQILSPFLGDNAYEPHAPFEYAEPSKKISKHAHESKKQQARKALAGITKGYLNYLNTEGENMVQTIGGDPNKKPSIEQLKYERYWAKILFCFENASKIIDKSSVQELIQQEKSINTFLRANFSINRAGTMSNLQITKSSGYPLIDALILKTWQLASTSFPPLPSYIEKDSIDFPCHFSIHWEFRSSSFACSFH